MWIRAQLVAPLALAGLICGCSAHHPTPAPAPAVRATDPSRPGVVSVDSVTRREVLTDDAMAKIRAAGTTVDTIIVTPDTVTVHVGSTIYPGNLVKSRALDAAGQPVVHFVPVSVYPQSDLYRFPNGDFEAASVGETVFYVEALPRDPREPRPRPSTAVVLKVIP